MKKILYSFLAIALLLGSSTVYGQYDNSSLSGPWMILWESNNGPSENMYIDFDGMGNITDVGNNLPGLPQGTYVVDSTGSFTMQLTDVQLIGMLTSTIEGGISVIFDTDTMEALAFLKISDISEMEGRWEGTFTSEDSMMAPMDFVMDVNSMGEISGFQGITGPVTGYAYEEASSFASYPRTGSDSSMTEFLMTGVHVGSTVSGYYNNFCGDTTMDCPDGTFSMTRTGVSMDQDFMSETSLTIFPNPLNSSSVAEFSIEKEGDYSMTIISSTGKLIKESNLGFLYSGLHMVSLADEMSSLSTGIYLMVIKSERGSSSLPFLVK